jgi:hypothetical protein
MANQLVAPRAAEALGIAPADVDAVVHKNRIELQVPDQPISDAQLGSLATRFNVGARGIAFVRGPRTRITIRGNFR